MASYRRLIDQTHQKQHRTGKGKHAKIRQSLQKARRKIKKGGLR